MGYAKTILVTGGLGYIGSHIVCTLLQQDYKVIIVDNLSNTTIDVLDRIHTITNIRPIFYEMDVRSPKLDIIFREHSIDSVIHLANSKSVAESIKYPLLYYDNNLISTINLLQIMDQYNVRKLIFSSSITVYGDSPSPLKESSPIGIGITNPYGQTKYTIEQMLKSLHDWQIIVLRYANPVGSCGLLGDNPPNIPSNLMPFLTRVAYANNINNLGPEYHKLKIYGSDYETVDGTCVRDFIHVQDVAKAHVKTLTYESTGYEVFNVGFGKGITILELLNVFIRVNNVSVPYEFVDRRPGDSAVTYCDNELIREKLGWTPEKDLIEICSDAWEFQKKIINN
jgi:UDP-glucose 4-epimerase